MLSSSGRTVPLTWNSVITVTKLAGCDTLMLNSRLEGGDGENAFQQVHLCSAALQGQDAPLELTVWLTDAP